MRVGQDTRDGVRKAKGSPLIATKNRQGKMRRQAAHLRCNMAPTFMLEQAVGRVGHLMLILTLAVVLISGEESGEPFGGLGCG